RVHVRREGGHEGSKTEDQQVDLVGEASAVAVAEKAGDERAERHSQKRQRHELGVLVQGREAALDGRAEHRRADIEVVAVEEHAGADQKENAPVERRKGSRSRRAPAFTVRDMLFPPEKSARAYEPPVA